MTLQIMLNNIRSLVLDSISCLCLIVPRNVIAKKDWAFIQSLVFAVPVLPGEQSFVRATRKCASQFKPLDALYSSSPQLHLQQLNVTSSVCWKEKTSIGSTNCQIGKFGCCQVIVCVMEKIDYLRKNILLLRCMQALFWILKGKSKNVVWVYSASYL